MFLLAVDSPVGRWGVEGDAHSVHRIVMPNDMVALDLDGSGPEVLLAATQQLAEYFAGTRRYFSVSRALVPATVFQYDCWRALETIPYGEVASYAEIAAAVGRPRAARAVGNANHANPWPLVVPCHRVVAANGLGGYGGGIDVKEFLLELERSSVAANA
jgi:methylated-DNA-[protein]-cysteine S-methyltransferase